MARRKVFDLNTAEGRALLDSAYQRYMEPNWTILNVAALFDVSPTTLTNAFKEVRVKQAEVRFLGQGPGP